MKAHWYALTILGTLFIALPICVKAQQAKVSQPVGSGETPLPLGELMRLDAEQERIEQEPRVMPLPHLLELPPSEHDRRDPAIQETYRTTLGQKDLFQSFEGQSNLDNQNDGDGRVAPPDMNIAVGPDHIVQMVNSLLSIYSKAGTHLAGPSRLSSIWVGNDFDECRNHGHGDPIVVYDEYANRWLLTEFAFEDGTNGPWYQCIAVSETDDPTGFYYLYQYETDELNDYPKFGVGHDSYLYTYVIDGNGNPVVGAFERTRMLNGQEDADHVLIELNEMNLSALLPADWDGPLPSNPLETPRVFAGLRISPTNNGEHEIPIFRFNLDWAVPDSATVSEVETLHPLWFDPNICDAFRERCIDQPEGAPALEAISDRLMFPLTIRGFGTHLSMTANHTVWGNGAAGIRWYEFRSLDNG